MKKKLRLKRTLKQRIKLAILRKRNIFSLLSFILIILFIVLLGVMNLLPNKYLWLIGYSLVVLDIFSICIINLRNKLWLKILGGIIMAFIIVFCSIGLYYIATTNSFLNDMFSNFKK